MHPFFDPTSFSDDELLKKVTILRGKAVAAYNMGLSFEAIDQMNAMIDMILLEQFERSNRKYIDDQVANYKIIETDEELKHGEEQSKEGNDGSSKSTKDVSPKYRPANTKRWS